MPQISPQYRRSFRRKIRGFYRHHARPFPWRDTRDPYAILVSEIMLQQTQTDRVLPKYQQFLVQFPSFVALDAARLPAVIRAWQGLGYNRRALLLKRCAREVVERYQGRLPPSPEALQTLPGIGPYTAAAVATFAFDTRQAFIETNIRSVFLEEFFARKRHVSDKDILRVVEQTLPDRKLREWYYALMDYGASLKRARRGINQRSAHYVRQTAFKGSNRERRGKILRILGEAFCTLPEICRQLNESRKQVNKCLDVLRAEGFLRKRGEKFGLADVREA